MSADPTTRQKTTNFGKLGAALGWIAVWAWTIVAGGGGLLLLLEKGPLPLTNGWFALLSGISACPLTASLLRSSQASRSRFVFGFPQLLSSSSQGELP